MKSAQSFCIVLVTAPSPAVARKLTRAALDQRLVACVNRIAGIESSFWWQGRIETAREQLLVMKTRRSLLPRLEKLIRELHPYDTPEILAVPLAAGSQRYLDWIQAETR